LRSLDNKYNTLLGKIWIVWKFDIDLHLHDKKLGLGESNQKKSMKYDIGDLTIP